MYLYTLIHIMETKPTILMDINSIENDYSSSDIFFVEESIEIEDYYYGFRSKILCIFQIFEDAKTFVDDYIQKNNKYMGERYYIQIIGMKYKETKKTILFDSNNIQ